MLRALDELRIEGIKTTVPLHREILGHAAFVEGRIDTTFVERSGLSTITEVAVPATRCVALPSVFRR